MTQNEWITSAHYEFLFHPDVVTMRKHYERYGRPFGTSVINRTNICARYYDDYGNLMFSVYAENLFQLYNKTYNMESASMQ